MATQVVWAFCFGIVVGLCQSQMLPGFEHLGDIWGPFTLLETPEPPEFPTTPYIPPGPVMPHFAVTNVKPDPCLFVLSQPDYIQPEKPEVNKTVDRLIEDASTGKNDLHTQGVFLVELDMALTVLQLSRLKPTYASQLGVTSFDYGANRVIQPWSHGVIPYQFEPGHFDCIDKFFILKAMAQLQEQTCITFRVANPYHQNSLKFVNRDGCWSYLGMIGGQQELSLMSPGCVYNSIILHELGHAVGLVHEHNLPARDRYLQVFWNNIQPSKRQWFTVYPTGVVGPYDSAYSFSSVMHYSSRAFSIDGNRTMQTRDPTKHHLINEFDKKLSFKDLRTINQMYNCAAHCFQEVECEKPGYVDKNCKCVCPCGHECGNEVENEVCKNMISDETCMAMAAAGECTSNPQAMITICCLACTNCFGEVPCGDYNKACPELAHRGACFTMSPYMNIYCKQSCGLCPRE